MTDYNFKEVLNCVDLLINNVINAERLDEQNSCDDYLENLLTRINDLKGKDGNTKLTLQRCFINVSTLLNFKNSTMTWKRRLTQKKNGCYHLRPT